MVTNQRYTEYDTWAWLYNQTMGPEYGKTQLQPLQTLLLKHLPESAKLLDLCCGTGHVMQYLFQQGYLMTGLDGSETMLYYAAQNVPRAEFVLADARKFDLPNCFDAVYSMSASLNHMMTLPDLQAVFHSVHATLKDNGLFLFDLNHPEQMQKWWVGRIVEGEISAAHAWYLTSMYSATNQTGYFQITLFQAPSQTPKSALQPVKNLIYRLLSLRFLTRLRLKALSRFADWQHDWRRSEIRYHVRGYPETEVISALQTAGFTDISTSTLEGHKTIDNNHSIYFLCRKPFRQEATA
jgi:SAM-dependent methyltransferase